MKKNSLAQESKDTAQESPTHFGSAPIFKSSHLQMNKSLVRPKRIISLSTKYIQGITHHCQANNDKPYFIYPRKESKSRTTENFEIQSLISTAPLPGSYSTRKKGN